MNWSTVKKRIHQTCQKTPRKYQLWGVCGIETAGGRVILADEMGLGKTVQALMWAAIHPELRPVVIACPAQVKLQWAEEIRETLKGEQSVFICSGTKHSPIPPGTDFVIVNYDILQSSRRKKGGKMIKDPETGWAKPLADLVPGALFLDEAHYVKNWSSGRTKGVRTIAKRCPHVVPISGTIIENCPIEYFTPLNLVAPGQFPYTRYVQRYCIHSDAKKNEFHYRGAKRTDELHELTKPYIIRRLKSEVAKDLPRKMSTVVPLELFNIREYEMARDNFTDWIEKRKRIGKKEFQSRVDALKLLAWEGKQKMLIKWVENILRNGEKLIVYARRLHIREALLKAFEGQELRLDGSIGTGPARDAVKQAFLEDPSKRVLVANFEVVTGMDGFQKVCSNVVWAELPWKPSHVDQANDRLHRIGQENTVGAWFLLGAGTVEEELAELLDAKRDVVSQILDGKQADSDDLLTMYAAQLGLDLDTKT